MEIDNTIFSGKSNKQNYPMRLNSKEFGKRYRRKQHLFFNKGKSPLIFNIPRNTSTVCTTK